MDFASLGKYIRKYRIHMKLRQEDLAETVGVSTNYIGMIERGEKVPSLETFVKIANALCISSDLLLVDMLNSGFAVKSTLLSEKIDRLPEKEKQKAYELLDLFITQSNK